MPKSEKNKFKISEMQGYSQRITLAMSEKQYSQTELSKVVGLSQAEISNFAREIAFPRRIVSQQIAKELRCSYLWLNYGQGEPGFERKIYELDEFWLKPWDRMAYLVWVSKLTLREFLILFPYKTGPMWFEEGGRVPTPPQVSEISSMLNYPVEFITTGEFNDGKSKLKFLNREHLKVFGSVQL